MAIIRLLFTSLPLLPFFPFFSSSAELHAATDTLSRGQSLSGDQTLVSEGGNFEFGFFTPGDSHKYYVGIWYKKVSKQTVVWVANRVKPVSNASASEVNLSEDGNLVLAHSKKQIWSSNSTSTASNSMIAVLLDSGNLILKDENSSRIFWQSFDHPTNAWLPGAKLGYDKLNKVDSFLTSWKNSEDPSPGPFSVEISPNGISQFYFLANRTRQYWTTGVWDGQIFSEIPEMRSNYFFNFNYVANMNVNYFSYYVRDTSSISNFMLDFTGRMIRQQWDAGTEQWALYCSLPRDPCDVYALCGSFSSCSNYSSSSCECLQGFEPVSMKEWSSGDHTSGCARKTSLQCNENDGFMKLSDVQLPTNPESLAVNGTKECRSTCSSNCSCVAFSYDTKCLTWNGDFLNLKKLSESSNDDENVGVFYLRLAGSELARPKSEKLRIVAVIGSVVGLALVTTFGLVLIWWRFCRKPAPGTPEAAQGFLVPFDYKVIKRATKDFSEKLGQGSFGTVFKGILPDSTVIAVKKLEGFRQGEKQFRMEVSTIGTIHHVNLVRLLGFCSKGDRRLLVYDYIPRGSLDSYLFKSSSKILDWKQRYQIALGIARGLAYLHEKCRECIMHCDIKPENILLDMNLCPKIADFGMAKLLGHEFSRVLTSMRGTFGYLAPEWLTGSAITPKADVYTYGLMLLEIISGRRNTDRIDGELGYFPLWAAFKVHEGDVLCLLDEKLEGGADVEELSRACKIACWCIQDQESSRPTMGHVVQQLEGVLDMGMPPIPSLLQKLAADDRISFLSESTG